MRTDIQAEGDRQPDMTKLIAAFRNFANAPKISDVTLPFTRVAEIDNWSTRLCEISRYANSFHHQWHYIQLMKRMLVELHAQPLTSATL